ncbi:hypothetical protein ACE1SV_70130 [Streptomyces sp. E-15]
MRYRTEYWALLGTPPVHSRAEARKVLEELIDRRSTVIGSVDECVDAVRDVQKATGGFGRLLITVLDWADREAMKRSFELFARFVAPRFNGALNGVTASYGWVREQALAHHAAEAARATGTGRYAHPPIRLSRPCRARAGQSYGAGSAAVAGRQFAFEYLAAGTERQRVHELRSTACFRRTPVGTRAGPSTVHGPRHLLPKPCRLDR